MRTLGRSCFALGSAALLLAGCPQGWVQESSGVDVDLLGVWSLDGDVAFAVGAGGTVLMRDSGSWRPLASGTEEDLHAVWGTAADHVVVVGDAGTALQYDGPIEPPDPPPEEPLPDLRALGVQTPSNFWCIDGLDSGVAYVGGEGRLQSYNGEALADGANLPQTYGLCAPVEGFIYACGPPRFDDQGALVRGGLNVLTDGAWADHDPTVCPVELEVGLCPLPEESMDHPILWGVWVGANGHGVVVGSGGAIFTWPRPTDGAWLPLPTRLTTDLRAVAGRELEAPEGDPDAPRFEAIAVGEFGAAFRITGDELKGEPIDTNQNLRDVWMAADGAHAYVVGEGGVIFHLYR